MTNYLRDDGIEQVMITPYTPQSNGISERRNRTLCEMARCMINQYRLSYGQMPFNMPQRSSTVFLLRRLRIVFRMKYFMMKRN